MKHLAMGATLVLSLTALPALADGVAVTVGQPGFYGAIELGNAPMPQLVYPQSVLVQPLPYGVVAPPPLFLRVPPGYARHWRWHCQEFGACGRPVYFVREGWYNRVYLPYFQGHREEGPRGFRREGEFRGEHRGRD